MIIPEIRQGLHDVNDDVARATLIALADLIPQCKEILGTNRAAIFTNTFQVRLKMKKSIRHDIYHVCSATSPPTSYFPPLAP